ncbi:hypothetical protein WJX75_007138 [Coccomyxa subellipsoidea]|uniref:Rab-GAP TBC domain-containing protein n=1 Tax=Coccomyxa subellipsoidea TaxID=248742 RepID=A0ABR2YL73_9CHLO
MDASATVLQIFRNILTIKQEDDQLRVIDLQVGSQVHNRVPGNLRTELWLSCLHRKGVGSGYASQYQAMLHKGISEEAAYDIEKDVGRTFPGLAKFATAEGKEALERVLRAYAAFDTEVNYCQGMNFLAALLLIWLPREADAFGALVLIMKDRGLRELYKTDMIMLQARLWQLGKIMPRHLARHMDQHCAIPVLYASSWLLTAFASDFPIFFSSRVMDIILADRYLEAMMKVVVGILKACEKRLLPMTDMEKMVDFLRGEVPRWPHDKLQELLTEALAAEWTPEQAVVLERTEGAESVVDAVQRVASNTPQGTEMEEEAAEAGGTPTKSRPKLASFSWASKLSAASSNASSAGQPNLLQSLTGSLSGFGASLPSYYDAAKQMTSSSLSPLGDLLGLFDSPKTSPEPAAAPSTHADSTSHGDSPAGSRQPDSHQLSSSHASDEHRVPSPAGMTRGNDREQSTLGRGQLGSGQPSGRHRPNRSDAESMVSWGSFREPEQADAPTQTPNFPGQTPANDFLIRLCFTPSGHRSHSGDRETSPDLISTGEPSQGGDASEDPFHHVALTEPLSQAQMHRDKGKKQRAAVSDWEDSQISGFAADSSGGSRHVPMRRAAGV